MITRVLVATDRSDSADTAVRWAADMANRYEAELVVLQVVLPRAEHGEGDGQVEPATHHVLSDLATFAKELAGDRGHARVVVDEDPARAIVQMSEDADVDAVVVGNLGMSGRTSFLLGNVPNRVSHNARCDVIIVNTARAVSPEREGRAVPIPTLPHIAEEEAEV
ncbi:MAG TPA: universal stress protein, partial [Actinomycetota bacterium]|nr:universal stress protein [Actinomycetota bacterium]